MHYFTNIFLAVVLLMATVVIFCSSMFQVASDTKKSVEHKVESEISQAFNGKNYK